MSGKPLPFSLRDFLCGWIYEICFNVCCRIWYPGVKPEDIGFVDTNEFAIVGREEFEQFEKWENHNENRALPYS